MDINLSLPKLMKPCSSEKGAYCIILMDETKQSMILLWISNPLPNDNILDWSKLKAFTEDKSNVADEKNVSE